MLQTLRNFKATKTGSGVKCLRLTAVEGRVDVLHHYNIGLNPDLKI